MIIQAEKNLEEENCEYNNSENYSSIQQEMGHQL